MILTVIPKISLSFAVLIVVHRINCEKNNAMLLSCSAKSEFFRYKRFEVNFYLSPKKQKYQLLTPESIASGEVGIDIKKRTVLIVHGLNPKKYMNLMYNLGDAFLQWDDVNLIYIDWSEGCPSPLYYKQAVRNSEYAAIAIKTFFKYLIETWRGTIRSIEHWGPLHFIGLSLGAHVAGQAGELLKEGDQPLVHRVTGLDPSEPCFDNVDSPLRIKKSNARYVDIIHTGGARKVNSALSILEPMGHVDFYVNGGSIQPGCKWLSFRELKYRKKRDLEYLRLGFYLYIRGGLCNHIRSIHLFTESLKQTALKHCRFWAHPWDLKSVYSKTPPSQMKQQCDETKCIEMGINSEFYNQSTNIYYVSTTGTLPYCQA